MCREKLKESFNERVGVICATDCRKTFIIKEIWFVAHMSDLASKDFNLSLNTNLIISLKKTSNLIIKKELAFKTSIKSVLF